MLEKDRSGLIENDRTTDPVEQSHAVPFLKRDDRSTDGRLRHVHRFGSLGDVLLAGDFGEDAQLVEGHEDSNLESAPSYNRFIRMFVAKLCDGTDAEWR